MVVYPSFQAQNPAISKYQYGWLSCTSFAGAMVASFDRQVKLAMTGAALRNRTQDFTGGLTLAQIDTALNRFWSIDLGVVYRLPWATYERITNTGVASVLQGRYSVIADSRFDAGHGFQDNHAIAVMPNWVGMDPLADGRYPDVYKFRGEPYPRSLLRAFAGALDLDPRSGVYKPLGAGYVYAAFSADRVNNYGVKFSGGAFWVYRVDQATGRIVAGSRGRYARTFASPTTAPCGIPKVYKWENDPADHPGVYINRTLVPVTAGALKGQFVAVPQWNVSLYVRS